MRGCGVVGACFRGQWKKIAASSCCSKRDLSTERLCQNPPPERAHPLSLPHKQ